MHVPVWRAKQITPSSEFQKFLRFEAITLNHHEKADWYAAAIAEMIIKAQGGGQNTSTRDFLLNFKEAEPRTDDWHKKQQHIWEAAFGKKATHKTKA